MEGAIMTHKTLEAPADIITALYSEIESTFAAVGANTPPLHDLYDSPTWRYCPPISQKHKGKIGYLCTFIHTGKRPRVKIVVHSFAQGGQSIVFDSAAFDQPDAIQPSQPHYPRLKRPTQRDQWLRQKKEQAALARKQQRYEDQLACYLAATPYVGDHPYVIHKGICETTHLKRLDQHRIAFPLVDVDGHTHGIQIIDTNGSKLIYGKKKGFFAPLGDLPAATRVYVCEGYATANAVYQLVQKNQKRHVPFCVIAAIDAHNLPVVVNAIRARFKQKILTVCPDHDTSTTDLKKNNVGLLAGYQAAITGYCDLKRLPPDTFPGSDWCDAWLHNEHLAVDCFAQTTKRHQYTFVCDRLQYFGQGNQSISLKKACVQALQVGAGLYPASLSENDLLQTVITHTAHTAISAHTIRYWWSKIKRRKFAQALRAKSFAKQQPNHVTIIPVASLQAAHEKADQLKKQVKRAVFITNAPMGQGKTKDFIQPAFIAADIQGDIPVIITPTKALTKGVSERLGASHYLDDRHSDFSQGQSREEDDTLSLIPSSLAITINSIITPKYQNMLMFSKAIFIDEYTQVLRAITSGTVEPTLKRATERKLASLMQHSDYTYIADADFHQIALDQLLDIVGDRPIYIFTWDTSATTAATTNAAPTTPSVTQEYRYYQHKDGNFSAKYILSAIEQAASDGQTLYIASDSKTQLDTFMTALAPLEIDTLLIHADNANFPAQRAFLDDPNRYILAKKPQVVLVSPCVQSGVSIEVDYFDRCFGAYSGTVSPVVFQQMLHRVRAQSCFELSLPSRGGLAGPQLTENATALLTGAYAEYIRQSGGIAHIKYDPQTKAHTIGQVRITEEGGRITLAGDDDYARYEVLSAQLQALDTQQSHHAANFLLLQAMSRGVTLTPVALDCNEIKKSQIKQTHKIHKTSMELTQIEKILTAQAMDAETYRQHTASGQSTCEQDYLAVKRFEVATDLNKPTDTLEVNDVRFYQQQGCAYVANYHALLQGVQKAADNDKTDREQGVAKTNAKWRASKVTLLRLLFDTLQLDPHTGLGSYTTTDAHKTRHAIQQDAALVRYMTFKLHLNVDSHLSDTAFINKILKKLLGVRVSGQLIRDAGERYRVYTLQLMDMMRLRQYHQLKFPPCQAMDTQERGLMSQ
jgi:hypothetical protein